MLVAVVVGFKDIFTFRVLGLAFTINYRWGNLIGGTWYGAAVCRGGLVPCRIGLHSSNGHQRTLLPLPWVR